MSKILKSPLHRTGQSFATTGSAIQDSRRRLHTEVSLLCRTGRNLMIFWKMLMLIPCQTFARKSTPFEAVAFGVYSAPVHRLPRSLLSSKRNPLSSSWTTSDSGDFRKLYTYSFVHRRPSLPPIGFQNLFDIGAAAESHPQCSHSEYPTTATLYLWRTVP